MRGLRGEVRGGGTNVRQPAMRQSAAAMRQCGNAAMRQCGNAAMILKQKFINKDFHKKQIFVTNNPKILQSYNPTFVWWEISTEIQNPFHDKLFNCSPFRSESYIRYYKKACTQISNYRATFRAKLSWIMSNLRLNSRMKLLIKNV